MRKFAKTLSCVAVMGSALLVAEFAQATRSYITNATINQVRVYGDGTFGQCVAVLSANVNTDGGATLNCPQTKLVSFDCGGEVGSKSLGNLAFQNAQLAYASGSRVDLFVDDGVQFNQAVCFSNFLVVKP